MCLNIFRAEGFGLQDARKGCRFLDFPPVLQLQLKRFEYDAIGDAMVKVNDRFEFPVELDLSPFLYVEQNSSTTSQGGGEEKKIDRPRCLYSLHSVLVHTGSVHGGHYYAFIRPLIAPMGEQNNEQQQQEEKKRRSKKIKLASDTPAANNNNSATDANITTTPDTKANASNVDVKMESATQTQLTQQQAQDRPSTNTNTNTNTNTTSITSNQFNSHVMQFTCNSNSMQFNPSQSNSTSIKSNQIKSNQIK